jgi:hypothetical protein
MTLTFAQFWRKFVRLPNARGELVCPTPTAEQARVIAAVDAGRCWELLLNRAKKTAIERRITNATSMAKEGSGRERTRGRAPDGAGASGRGGPAPDRRDGWCRCPAARSDDHGSDVGDGAGTTAPLPLECRTAGPTRPSAVAPPPTSSPTPREPRDFQEVRRLHVAGDFCTPWARLFRHRRVYERQIRTLHTHAK